MYLTSRVVVLSLPFAWVVIRKIGVTTFDKVVFKRSEFEQQPVVDSKTQSLSDEKAVYA